MSLKGLRWKVESSAATMTVLPVAAQRSHRPTTSGKNWPCVDADDVEGVDDVVHLGESARGEGGERLTVVGDDASLEGGEASAPPAAAPGSLSYRVSPAYLTTRH